MEKFLRLMKSFRVLLHLRMKSMFWILLNDPLNPLLQIRTALEGFLKTTFPMANDAFGAMGKLLGGTGSVFKGPYVSLGYTPYLHQEQAFLRLQSSVGASTIIATGTGSGKTESFSLAYRYPAACVGWSIM